MDADEEYEELIERRRANRQRKARRSAVLGIVALLVLSVVVVVIVIVAISGRDATHAKRPAANSVELAKDGVPLDDWTHRDLAEHLKKKGVEVEVKHGGAYDQPGRPASAFYNPKENAAIIVYLCSSAKEAKEVSGSMGEGSFSSERFAIGCGIKREEKNLILLGRVRKALTGR
ncbi:hypothetical protein J8F10_06660 [Gemmata sp. G18]|uniref:Uncharacterized protein n=1 Tax=Gemmata palustris TaxID=2822762 RepID=A0ABS5BMM0_9BACT|nr:hypothetical protein [Gemmata palustris]MBP3954962.1 hypothetical protein [Gemmata palustris]